MWNQDVAKHDMFHVLASTFGGCYTVVWDYNEAYPLVICYIAIENGPVEIVDLPIENGDLP